MCKSTSILCVELVDLIICICTGHLIPNVLFLLAVSSDDVNSITSSYYINKCITSSYDDSADVSIIVTTKPFLESTQLLHLSHLSTSH